MADSMLEIVTQMPEMLEAALGLTCQGAVGNPTIVGKTGKISKVIVCGMGGSAIAGDIIATAFGGQLAVPLVVNRNYHLPAWVGTGTLLFAVSYSGNTEETLSAVKEAAKTGAKIVCVTAGGVLKELAEKKAYPYYLVPSNYQPRAALPFMLVALLRGLEQCKVVKNVEEAVRETITLLRRKKEEYKAGVPLRNNPARGLAQKMKGKIPLIFAVTGTTDAAGHRFMTQLNENGKTTALLNCFPELDHNEIVNLSVLKRENHNFLLIILRSDDDNERIKKRIEITKSLLARQLGGANEYFSQGKTKLTQLMSLIYFGDFVSVYAALERQIEPTPVAVIERLKKEMAR